MNIIILGAGRVGESVAESLVSEQNDITVIDQDPARLKLLEERLVGIFRRDGEGRRAFNGQVDLFQNDPNWRDLILFNEYFHGDNGSGVGASHQTGWSAMTAKMINQLSRYPSG